MKRKNLTRWPAF